uniref:Uncharacterized protein n=1 Tax=Arundo donax TaxID=35708 RepID=A0A0A9F9A0_ARUDO
MMVHQAFCPVLDQPIKYKVPAQQRKPPLLPPDASVQVMVTIKVLLKLTFLVTRTTQWCISLIWARDLSLLWQLRWTVLLPVQCSQKTVIKNVHPIQRNERITCQTEQVMKLDLVLKLITMISLPVVSLKGVLPNSVTTLLT